MEGTSLMRRSTRLLPRLALSLPMAAGANPEVQTALKLTDDQKQKIAAMLMQQQQAMRDLFQSAGAPGGGGGGGFAAIRDKMEALRKDASAKISALLTEDQQKQWKEMQGAPFTGQLAP